MYSDMCMYTIVYFCFLFVHVDEAEMQDLVQGHMTSEQGQTLRPPEVVITDADDVDDVIDGAMMSVVAVAKPGTEYRHYLRLWRAERNYTCICFVCL